MDRKRKKPISQQDSNQQQHQFVCHSATTTHCPQGPTLLSFSDKTRKNRLYMVHTPWLKSTSLPKKGWRCRNECFILWKKNIWMSDSLCQVSLSSVFKTLKNLCPGMREKNQLGLGLGQSVIIFSRLVMMSAVDQRSDPGEILFNIQISRDTQRRRKQTSRWNNRIEPPHKASSFKCTEKKVSS